MPERFFKLPQALTTRRDLTSSDKLLYAVLADRMGDSGKCWPGVRTLAGQTGLCRDAVADSVARLERAGVIQVERRGPGQTNVYRPTEQPVGQSPTDHPCPHPENAAGSVRNSPTVQAKNERKKSDSAGGKSRTQVSEKIRHNQTDQVNQTKREYDPDQIIAYWNQLDLPAVEKLTPQQHRRLLVRLKEHTFLQHWRTVFDKIAESAFLTGSNRRGWRADFDWIIRNQTNYRKVLKDAYYDHPARLNAQPHQRPPRPTHLDWSSEQTWNDQANTAAIGAAD